MTGHPELAVFSVAPRPRHAFTNAPPVD
jgi:hypothetical protein